MTQQPSPYFIRRTTALEDADPLDNRVASFDDEETRARRQPRDDRMSGDTLAVDAPCVRRL